MKRKGQIIVQNDCWVGNGVTIMGGVTIHNGAIVATQAVVTKDVPPYAIVAGNPARIIKYRFDEQRIAELQKIAWWDWDSTKIEENAELFYDDALVFIQKHIAFAEQQLSEIPELPMDRDAFEEIYLFIPDFNEPYPIYPKVFTEFLTRFTSEKYQLLVYFEDDTNIEENMSKIDRIASCYPESNCCINFCYPKINDERSLFKAADYFITTRAKENVRRMCFADLFDVTCISGVDDPIFSELI